MDRRDFLKTCGVAVPGLGIAGVSSAAALALPTARALEWADCELGVLIHYDITVFEPGYEWRKQWGYHPDPRIFNPSALSTDQWMSAAQSAGAKYAVLVAKHCSGFSLWPTRAHEYSVKSTPWKNGKGDIVAEFVDSCRKFGIRPGIYCSAVANAYFQVDNPGLVKPPDPEAQKRYNQVVVTQFTELWSNYGKLFEIWFDGGVLPPDQGGPELAPLISLQPDAIYFQGPSAARNLIRWSGNEFGTAPEPNWSAADITTSANGAAEIKDRHGNPRGNTWCPAEADLPIRKWASYGGGWIWKQGQDSMLKSKQGLVKSYYKSVGRNANMMLGMVVDDRGLVPEADCRLLREFGDEIRRRFATPMAEASGRGNLIELSLGASKAINHAVLMEDLSQGQRILRYRVEGFNGLFWQPLARGESIGHKRIHRFPDARVSKIRLKITDALAEPLLRSIAVFKV